MATGDRKVFVPQPASTRAGLSCIISQGRPNPVRGSDGDSEWDMSGIHREWCREIIWTRINLGPRPSNFCGVCNGYIYDGTDDPVQWIQCPELSTWLQVTCAERLEMRRMKILASTYWLPIKKPGRTVSGELLVLHSIIAVSMHADENIVWPVGYTAE